MSQERRDGQREVEMIERHVVDVVAVSVLWAVILVLALRIVTKRCTDRVVPAALEESASTYALLTIERGGSGLTKADVNLVFSPGQRPERQARLAVFDDRARYELAVDLDEIVGDPSDDDLEAG